MDLPPPRRPDAPYSVALVCLGNICRSPMAHVVLQDRVEAAGLAPRVLLRSAGTAGWHVGRPMDRRAAATLTAAGYDASRHRAHQLSADDAQDSDLVLAMDSSNLADLAALAPDGETRSRLRRFRDFDPEGPGDVPDPYYGDESGFDEVLAMVERTADALVRRLAAGWASA